MSKEFQQDYFTDHLGNIRLLYSDLNGDGEIKVLSDGNITHCDGTSTSNGEVLQEQHYYPYGLTMGGLNYTSDVLTDLDYGRDQHLYTGKELTEKDLNLYNFGARWYDMSLGRWFGHDPEYQFASPYLAMGNNPISNIDPDGKFVFTGLLPGVGVFIDAALWGAVIGGTTGGLRAVWDGNDNTNFWDGAWKGAIVGAVGGALAPIGGAGMSFGANVAIGAGQGAATGALDAALWGNNVWKGAAWGAVAGAAFATVTSDNFKNWTKGKGFRSNNDVLTDFVSEGEYNKALDYFGFDGEFKSSEKLLKEMNNVNIDPNIKEAGYMGYTTPEGEIFFGESAFSSYGNLKSTYFKESYHSSRALQGIKFKTQDVPEGLPEYFKIAPEERLGSIYMFKNNGLYPSVNAGSFINSYQAQMGLVPSDPGYFNTESFWNFIYKIPRRF